MSLGWLRNAQMRKPDTTCEDQVVGWGGGGGGGGEGVLFTRSLILAHLSLTKLLYYLEYHDETSQI